MVSKSLLNIIGIPIRHGQKQNGTQYSPGVLKSFMKREPGCAAGAGSDGVNKSYLDLLKSVYDVKYLGNFHTKVPSFFDLSMTPSEIVSYQCKQVYNEITSIQHPSYNLVPPKNIFIGGDHSMAIGSISSMLDIHKDNLKVIWIDAHADLNKPDTSLSGNLHGQPLSYLMGHNPGATDPGMALRSDSENEWSWLYPIHKLKANNLHYIGLRDLDDYEIDTINKLNINFYESPLLIETEKIIDEILSISPNQKIHVSLDVDGICPTLAPSTGTPVKDGITEMEIFTILDKIKETGNLVSLDITEINPLLGTEDELIKTLDISSKCILKSLV